MIQNAPIGWINTAFPLALLVVGAWVLPRVITPAQTRSQRILALAILISALALFILAAIIFALIYTLQGVGVGGAVTVAPIATALFFLLLSAKSTLAWVPILALSWFTLAQRIEALRGNDIVRGTA